MSHPVLWPRSFFYPVGNSSAVCLTDNIPPEKSVDVLLLGCGDPRNILYTLHADPPIQRPTLDFTCCDIEPAVIARNVLLFTLIYDRHQSNRIWDIFYHIKVDQTSFALLISQCKKLLDICRDLDTWHKSSYSRFLQFSSSYTLSQLRHYLELYAQTEGYSQAKHEQLFSSFTREFESRYSLARHIPNPEAARSAGPFSRDVDKILTKHFYHYWKTGTVSRLSTDVAAATFVNPTFVYSDSFEPSLVGNRCTLHYGIYPLKGFHLASAILTCPSSSSEETIEKQLVSCARSQFQEWCSAFQATASASETLTIRLITGHALAFCEKLAHLQSLSTHPDIHLFVSPWQCAELVLDGGNRGMPSAPTSFDVIDTSNLADHVGLLNVLLATVPLLAHGPTSVLYTEVAVKKSQNNKASNFDQLLCAGIPTIALLLGVAPAGSIAQFTSTSKVHDILMGDSYRERIAWKLPYHSDSLLSGGIVTPSFSDPLALAAVLFSIYEQLFADEDIGQLMSRLRVPQDIIHYNRGTFAALLGLVRSRVQSDWTAVMNNIFDRLQADRRLIMGSNNYQELCCQLYLRGVYCVEALDPEHTTLTLIHRKVGVFKGWKEVPPVVCLVLVIPRKRVKILEDMAAQQQHLGSPMFQCGVRGRSFHNIFSCIQATLGTASIQGSGSDAQVSIAEDTAGWSGMSPLVVSVFVPAFNLVVDPQSTQISLGLHSTPSTAGSLTEKLGMYLTLFTADIMDRSTVYVTPNRPNCSTLASTPIAPTISRTQVSVSINDSCMSTMTARWEIATDEPGINLKAAKVGHTQISPSAIRVAVNDYAQKNLLYPFPIDGTRAKVRIARKSGWIEIEAPIRQWTPSAPVDLTHTSFLAQNGCPAVWNIHRINFASLPVIEGKARLDRLAFKTKGHCLFAFSDREFASFLGPAQSKPVLVQVKESILCIFEGIVESSGSRVVVLADPENGGIYTVLYYNGIRMDLASHTFVADVCILPLTEELIEGPLGSKIVGLTQGAVLAITRGDGVVGAWKHLLVAFTERCRSWNHKSSCKYAISGQVPLSMHIRQNPLCGCGEGIGLGALSLDTRWKELAPLMTRAAISPLFAIAYLESVDSRLNETAKICVACHKPESPNSKLLKCGRCKEVEYCGKPCQERHWKAHKKACKAKVEAAKESI
ncbi:hypothetical protein C8R44DRAFT_612729 [Mycena epipterygia]|nr:hypothetical protein C8R44DRAFT_612729 [Mycena epipterygia]